MTNDQIQWSGEFVIEESGLHDLAKIQDHLDAHHPGWKQMPSMHYSVVALHREHHEHTVLCHPGVKELAEILPGEFSFLGGSEHSWHHAADGIITKLLDAGITVYTSPQPGVSTSQPPGTTLLGGADDG